MNELEQIIRTIREDAYEDGTHGAGHPVSVDKDKQAIKDFIERRINEHFNNSGEGNVYDFWKDIQSL